MHNYKDLIGATHYTGIDGSRCFGRCQCCERQIKQEIATPVASFPRDLNIARHFAVVHSAEHNGRLINGHRALLDLSYKVMKALIGGVTVERIHDEYRIHVDGYWINFQLYRRQQPD